MHGGFSEEIANAAQDSLDLLAMLDLLRRRQDEGSFQSLPGQLVRERLDLPLAKDDSAGGDVVDEVQGGSHF